MAVRSCAALVISVGCAPALAQQPVTVASLPFRFGQTAGPTAHIVGPPNESRDAWIIEDFSTAAWFRVTLLHVYGLVNPSQYGPQVRDVEASILDGLPTEGGEVVISTPAGAGRYTDTGGLSTSNFTTNFGGQYLPPGNYRLMWAAVLPVNQASCIYWHQPGPHAVNGGLPDNALQYNPGGGRNYPNHPYRLVPLTLEGTGRTGVNFRLDGFSVACYADCDNSTGPGALDIFDFLCFQNAFTTGDSYACECDDSTGRQTCDIFDFLCFQNAFDAGCP